MKQDTKRSNGKVVRVQACKAFRRGVSSMGTKFKKGDNIFHFSSSRATGEVFTITEGDMHFMWSAMSFDKWGGRP